MSEAPAAPAPLGTDPAPAGSAGAALYPDGGGANGAASAPLAPKGDVTVTDSQSAPSGEETSAGTSTEGGADSVGGNETTPGADSQPGADSLSADSYPDLKLPEGFVVDDALFTSAKTTFAELGISPEIAPKLLDLYATVSKAVNAQATESHAAQQTAWTTEINAMPEFQGEARAKSLQAIGKVFDEYGTPEARAALDAFGTGNNPALAKMFHHIASALSEGSPTSQGRPAPVGKDGKPISQSGRTIGQRLYPDQAQPQ